MKNDPLLYINSPFQLSNESSNQSTFDSRVRDSSSSEMEKIILSLKHILPIKKISIQITYDGKSYEGYVKEISNGLICLGNEKEDVFLIKKIEKLNILCIR